MRKRICCPTCEFSSGSHCPYCNTNERRAREMNLTLGQTRAVWIETRERAGRRPIPRSPVPTPRGPRDEPLRAEQNTISAKVFTKPVSIRHGMGSIFRTEQPIRRPATSRSVPQAAAPMTSSREHAGRCTTRSTGNIASRFRITTNWRSGDHSKHHHCETWKRTPRTCATADS